MRQARVGAPKMNVMDEIMSRLYTVHKKEFDDRIIDMAVRNGNMVNGAPEDHFSYLGVVYHKQGILVPRLKTRLHPELHADWQKDLEWRSECLTEATQVRSYLSALFNQWSIERIKRVLPSTLHSLFNGLDDHFKPLQKTEEEFENFLKYHETAIKALNFRLTEALLFS